MENFKFGLISVIVLAGIGLLGYWAFATLEPGDLHAYKERQQELEAENRELKKEIARLESELGTLEAERETSAEVADAPRQQTPPTNQNPAPTTATYKHQSLINELERLIDQGVYMKVGSRGTRVGTIQNFLNLYNKTDTRVDNDYGPALKTAVTNFQKAVGTTADGETGPATYQKMIDWLKKQG